MRLDLQAKNVKNVTRYKKGYSKHSLPKSHVFLTFYADALDP